MKRLLWRLLAVLFLLLGVIGAFLPVMPTVPFLILAAWAGGRGWPALEAWLLDHPAWGPPIRRWREGGMVPRRAKWAATLMMSASALLLQFTGAALAVRLGVPLAMAAVAIWLWRRPEG